MEVCLFDIVQYLDLAVEKIFEPHVPWLASQAQPSNHLVSKVGALGDSFKIIPNAVLEVLLGPFCSFVLCGTKVPFCDSRALETDVEQIELLVHVFGIFLMIFIPSNEKYLLKIGYGVGQCILGAKQTFVRGNLA